MNQLYTKIDFYRDAYSETSKDKKSLENKINNLKNLSKDLFLHIIERYLLDTISIEEEQYIEKYLGISLDDVRNSIQAENEKLSTSITEIKDKTLYKDYLSLIIDEDLEIVMKIEKDEIFTYLQEQKFYTNYFNNEPFIQIGKIIYQPRLWKFNKYADKLANKYGYENYKHLYGVYEGIRAKYKSLSDNTKTILSVVENAEKLNAKLLEKEQALNNLPTVYADRVKELLVKNLFNISIDKIVKFKDEIVNSDNNSIFDELISNMKSIDEQKTQILNLDTRLNLIMTNIDKLEEIIYHVENNNIRLSEEQIDKLINEKNPEKPIFEIIHLSEWEDLKRSFKEKGMHLNENSKYEKTVTKLSEKEKEEKLKKYGVKEGEIFIDENLKNKKF